MSVIELVKSNNVKTRNKYMRVRLSIVKEQVEKGNMRIAYLPTADMTADLFTKPLCGAIFRKHFAVMQNTSKRVDETINTQQQTTRMNK